jgi:CRP-like cAMP-binding protein
MAAEFLKNYYQKIAKISDRDWDVLPSHLIVREFSRNEKILEIGKTENYISFVQEGVCRTFCKKDSEEHTLSFSFPGDFACGYLSFLKRSPSFLSIQALTPY